MNWLSILKLILGTAENIVPVFIHNPKSQQIESVVVTTANEITNIASQLGPPTGPQPDQSTTGVVDAEKKK